MLAARAWGVDWGHTLSYGSRLDSGSNNATGDNPNGFRWFIAQTPELGKDASGNIQVIAIINDGVWFTKSGVNYVARYFTLDTLAEDTTAKEFTYTDGSGRAWKFYSFDGTIATALQGRFKAFIDAYGTTYTPSYNGSNQLTAVAFGGSPAISFNYEYYSGAGGKLQYVTLKRGSTNIRRLFFTYYASGDTNGSSGDLRTQSMEQWSGSSWEEVTTYYYRYYKTGDTDGFEHGLRQVLHGEAYRQAVAWGNAQSPTQTIDQISISDLNRFADNRFLYNSDGRVAEEYVAGPNRTSSSLTTARYQYAYATSTYVASTQSDRFNKWVRSTTETLPDGVTTNKVITNYAGQVILKDFTESGGGGRRWYTHLIYDSEGRVTDEVSSEAITGYSTNTNGDISVTINTSSGLIKVYSYYTTTHNPTGAVAGLLQTVGVKKGSGGSVIKIKDLNYENYTQSGRRFCPLRGERLFQSDLSGGSDAATTSFEYTLFSNSLRIEQRTTTLPVIATTQNGSGGYNYRTERYDQYGQLIWSREERGFLTRFKYDNASGGMTQRIDDVATGQISDSPAVPSGWSTPSGGGLHLITDYTVDNLGRATQELGPVHDIPVNGVNTTLRRAYWTVYRDAAGEVRSAVGYSTQSSSSVTAALIEPITVKRTDDDGRLTEVIVTRRASGVSGVLTGTENVSDQARWVRWTQWTYSNNNDSANQERNYFLIPTSGAGTSTDNYAETLWDYDVEARLLRQKNPSGTIRRWTYDVRGRVTALWIGTDDAGATASDPSAGGTNDMRQMQVFEYDFGGSGSSKLTKVTRPVDDNSSNDRETNYSYDWRNRRESSTGELNFREEYTLDNQGRVTRVDQKNGASGTLIGRKDTFHDLLGRVYRSITYAVNVLTGSVGNGLASNIWYDASGNIIKTISAGSNALTKHRYDGFSRRTRTYVTVNAADDTYTEAAVVTNDTVLEQEDVAYDAQSNVIRQVLRQRFHNATGAGELANPSVEPRARVSYTAYYVDSVGRPIAKALYGTNGGSGFSRPTTVPSRSDTVLVTTTEYGWSQLNSGESFSRAETIIERDPKNLATQTRRNSAGWILDVIDDIGSLARKTELKYSPSGQLTELIAINSTSGDQSTKYFYGTTLTESQVANKELLRSTIYPDSTDTSPTGTDQVKFEYNRQGQVTKRTDQAGTVHVYEYDKLARLLHDRVTTLGTNINGAVRRISRTYEVRGLPSKVSSIDSATVGSGSTINEVQYDYNDFGQVTSEWQDQVGAVNTGSSPRVQYAYSNGAANHLRLDSLTYPNGRVISYSYGASGSVDDLFSRITKVQDGATTLSEYSYLGSLTFVQVNYLTQPGIELTYMKQGAEPNGEAGDQYAGLDRFGRVIDQRWLKTSDGSNRARVQYGYDRNSNRLFRDDLVAASAQDELYSYDNINQLVQRQRGTLNSGRTAITGTPDGQEDFTYDPSGNWRGVTSGYVVRANGVVTLDQNRVTNKANEIQTVTSATGLNWFDPTYDSVGNMTGIPQPASLASGYTAKYDAWNRLVELMSGATSVAIYQYDGLYRRLTKLNGGQTRRHYYTIAWQVVEERINTSSVADRQFVWGLRYIDDLIERDRGSERFYVLHDFFNPTAIVDISGAVQERYGYEAFGSARVMDSSFGSRTTSSYDWETLFGAYRFDTETGLYYDKMRYLHPSLGVWITTDPLQYSDTTSLFAYCANAPINNIDAFGLTRYANATCSILRDNGDDSCLWECCCPAGYGHTQGGTTGAGGRGGRCFQTTKPCSGCRVAPCFRNPSPQYEYRTSPDGVLIAVAVFAVVAIVAGCILCPACCAVAGGVGLAGAATAATPSGGGGGGGGCN